MRRETTAASNGGGIDSGEPAVTDAESGSIATDAAQDLVGTVMTLSGAAKLAGVDDQVREFERYGYPQWFRVATGGVEVVGGLGLLAGLRRPALTLGGGGLVLGTMAGAVVTHLLRVRDPPKKAVPATLLFALTGLVVGRRRRRSRRANATGSTDDWRSR